MKKTISVTAFLLFLAVFCACGEKPAAEPFSSTAPALHTRTVFAMDTVMTLSVYGGKAEEALSAAEAELARLDALLDCHDEQSAVSSFNETGRAEDGELVSLLERCLSVSLETDGAFDVTIAPVLSLWDFSGSGRLPGDEEIEAALPLTGTGRLSVTGAEAVLSDGSSVDLGGIGKGYAGERLNDVYASYGVSGAASLGGDAFVSGPKADGSAWRIGVRDPKNSEGVLGVLHVTGGFVVTSGSYERYFEADGKIYHHILDPKTGSPAGSGLLSVTVLTDDGLRADALATAFFVLGEEKTKELVKTMSGVSAILVTENGRVCYPEALQDTFTDFTEGYCYEAY